MIVAVLFVLCSVMASEASSATGSIIRSLRLQYVDAETYEPYAMPERPILYLSHGDTEEQVLEVSFDEMSQDFKHYSYYLRHLNAAGVPDNLPSIDFIDGFTTLDITDYTPSINTQQIYTHYRFIFPNEDMRIKLSGNYELVVYEDGDMNMVVATVPIFVSETLVNIDGQVLSNTDIEISGRYQQLRLTVDVPAQTTNARDDYFIVVRQNNRTDNQVYAPVPTNVGSHRLEWDHCRSLIFEGGNEYRHFDAYSLYFAGTGVDRVVYENADYHVLLNEDELRNDRPYSHEYDVNGQYRINAARTTDADTEAEYMWVHWRLKAEQPFFDGAVYVGGDVFGNTFTLRNLMEYDSELQCYYLSAPLKQGGYDYQYWFMPKSGLGASAARPITLQRTEGSYWQTRNEYTVFVYYAPFGARYERLVGVKRLQ